MSKPISRADMLEPYHNIGSTQCNHACRFCILLCPTLKWARTCEPSASQPISILFDSKLSLVDRLNTLDRQLPKSLLVAYPSWTVKSFVSAAYKTHRGWSFAHNLKTPLHDEIPTCCRLKVILDVHFVPGLNTNLATTVFTVIDDQRAGSLW